MTYEFDSIDDHSIRLGESTLAIKAYYGLEPEKFLEFFHNLKRNYGLRLNNIEFLESVQVNRKTKGIVRPINHIVNFVIYCNILEEMGDDIDNLVGQIKNCCDLLEIFHADALATLGFIYRTAGHNIDFSEKGTDVIINSIRADLKTRLPAVLTMPRKPKITRSGSVDIRNEILLSISKRISGRFLEGSKQAELLFFDMSNDMGYGPIDLFGFVQDEMPDKIPEPSPYRLIFYRTQFLPNTIGDRMFKYGNTMISLPKRTFPDLHELRGYWIDFEPSLWKLLPTCSV